MNHNQKFIAQFTRESSIHSSGYLGLFGFKTMKKEFWKDVKGYEGYYQVSNLGRVKSLKRKQTFSDGRIFTIKERILKPVMNNYDYYGIGLHKECETRNFQIHQLVAICFLNHKPNGNKMVVNHINFNRVDNRLSNLEIITNRENTNQKHRKSSSKYVGVHWNKARKKWRARITVNGEEKHLGTFTNELDASKAYQDELRLL